MNVYSELDTAIQAKLVELTSLKKVEPYNNQYQNTEKDDPKPYPAVYYELLEPVNWQDAGNDWQTAQIRARMHVVVFDVKRTKNDIHAIGQEVFVKMENVTLLGTGGYILTSKWTRVSSSLQKRYKQLKVITIDFEFEIFDSSSIAVLGTQQVGFTVVPA